MSRRRHAPVIRARQELSKRLDRLAPAPRWRGPQDALRAVAPDAVALRRALAAGTGVTEALRDATPAEVLPAAWRARLAAGEPPPDAPALIEQAEALLRGDWRIFGRPFAVAPDGPRWRRHPWSGVEPPALHFSRLPVTAAVVGGDVKPLWELNRHAELVRLAQGWALTGDRRFADRLGTLLDGWAEQNPPGIGINWTAVLEVAFRAIAWCWAWHLSADAPSWTDARSARLLWLLDASARHIARFDSIHHSPNTHLTGEALGLLYVGTLFPVLTGATRWRTFGIEILASEIDEQWLPDGFHYERATYYHRYHAEFYLHALRLVGGPDRGPLDRARGPLEEAIDALVALRRPDGDWPVFGDADGGSTLRLWASRPDDPAPLIAAGAARFRRADWLHGLDDAARSLGWWLLDADDWQWLANAVATPPRDSSRSLPDAGYHVARDDWGTSAWYAAVDAGPHGGDRTGHAHTDVGHVEVAHGTRSIVADPGSLVYGGDEARREADRSLARHATLTIAGDPLAAARGPFGWRRVAPTPDWETHESGDSWWCRLSYRTDGGAAHERTVWLLRGTGVVVIDLVRAAPGATLAWHWPLALPAADTVLDQATGTLRLAAEVLHFATSVPGVARVDDATFAPSYGVERAGAVLAVQARTAEASAGACWVFTDVDAHVMLDPTAGRATIEADGRRWEVHAPAGGEPPLARVVHAGGSR